MSFIILIILVGIAAYIIYSLLQPSSSKTSQPARPAASSEMKIQNVDVGGTLMLSGIGPDIEDFDLVITAKHLYDEDGYTWHELEAERGAQKVWITVEEDDELELSISTSKHKLRDAGLSPESLDRFKSEDEGSFTFNDTKFHYEDYGKATFYRNGSRANGEKFKYWEFESEDERHYASVELWGSNEYELHISEALRPAQIRILTLRG